MLVVPEKTSMRTYDDPESEDYNPEAVEADRVLGRTAAEIIREKHFPEFRELVHTGVGCYEPYLIYRHGDSFLVADTEISDSTEEDMGVWGRELPDGRVAERGSREYLLAGVNDLAQRTEEGKNIALAIQSALSVRRVRYVLVTVVVSGVPGQHEAKSIELEEFKF
jgi:hypothetical protein